MHCDCACVERARFVGKSPWMSSRQSLNNQIDLRPAWANHRELHCDLGSASRTVARADNQTETGLHAPAGLNSRIEALFGFAAAIGRGVVSRPRAQWVRMPGETDAPEAEWIPAGAGEVPSASIDTGLATREPRPNRLWEIPRAPSSLRVSSTPGGSSVFWAKARYFRTAWRADERHS